MSKKRAINEGYVRGGGCSNNTTVKPDITPAAQPNTLTSGTEEMVTVSLRLFKLMMYKLGICEPSSNYALHDMMDKNCSTCKNEGICFLFKDENRIQE